MVLKISENQYVLHTLSIIVYRSTAEHIVCLKRLKISVFRISEPLLLLRLNGCVSRHPYIQSLPTQ